MNEDEKARYRELAKLGPSRLIRRILSLERILGKVNDQLELLLKEGEDAPAGDDQGHQEAG